MSRNGKIARLPAHIREQVNRRLDDGENGRDIVSWLNSNDEVKAVLAREFAGQEINEVNLCHWRQGGFRDWRAQQAALAEAGRIASEGRELGQTTDRTLSDNLAVWLTGRYILATRKLLENENDEAAWKLLRELCHDVAALRRGDHGAEWLRLEQERLKLQQQKHRAEQKKARNEKREKNPGLPPLSEEEKDRRYAEIFGIDYVAHSMTRKDNPFDADPDPGPPADSQSNPVKASQTLRQ